MCVAAEDELGGGSTAGVGGTGGSIPEIVVTAPRIGIDPGLYQLIDWSEVAKISGIGALGGAYSGGWGGAVVGGAAAGAAAVESQPDVDLEDLFVIKNDMLVIPGLPSPYLPMY
jgi:hypothetical protein